MIVVLSPAKKLNENHEVLADGCQPLYIEEAEKLINKLKKLSAKKIKGLMKLSDALAETNYHRYQNWSNSHKTDNSLLAAYMFDGEVYNGFDAPGLNKKEMDYAHDHVRILSGLYGILKPKDYVHPYRLEMGTKIKVGRANNLYEFWGNKLVDELNQDLEQQKERVLVNLASNEYFKAVPNKNLNARVVTPVFKDFTKGEYKAIMVYAKKARGMMANYIVKNKIEKADHLKGFDYDGYVYNEAASSEDELVFLRG